MDELTANYRVRIFKSVSILCSTSFPVTLSADPFISIWRPVKGVVEQWPLTVCDARSATMDDLDEMEYITDEFVRSSYLTKFNERHRFYYLSKMTSQEVCIFKIFDSAYHTAGEPGKSLRSIETDRPYAVVNLFQWVVRIPHLKLSQLQHPRPERVSRYACLYFPSIDYG